MQYYVHFGNSLSTKNQLEKTAASYLRSLDGTLIADGSLAQWQQMVKDQIAEFNQAHARCKPITISWWSAGDGEDIGLSGLYCVNVRLYPIYRSYPI